MPVVVLAGGLGTRLGPLTADRPKCLVDVNGSPFAVHQLRLLRSLGARRVTFCLGHLGAAVVAALGDGSALGLDIDYAFDGDRLLGTAGAIKGCLDRLPGSFFVTYGDAYLPCPLDAVQSAFESSGKSALMTVFSNRGRWDASNVEYRGGRIVAYDKAHRTDRMTHIDYGLGVFHRRAFEVVPGDAPFDLATLYQVLLSRGDLASFEVAERFYEVGSPSG
ncbi:MAG: NTP transferase domain-containing protein, partial [Planctomycetia bacterium]|nr:NTP transferase domain-containing protein [Planctomycetia bacterium]